MKSLTKNIQIASWDNIGNKNVYKIKQHSGKRLSIITYFNI